MAAPLVKTRMEGVYKRGGRYAFAYRDADGKQRWGSCRTAGEAREQRAKRIAEIRAPEAPEDRNVTLHEYVLGKPDDDGWIDQYRGNGKRGFREETRAEYRALLAKYALSHFGPGVRLVAITPERIDKFIGWLVKQPNGRGGTLSDKSVRNALGPLMACLASAVRQGKLRSNPAIGAALPHRPRIDDDDELPQPFPASTMELTVSLVHPDHRVMFELLAATGVRRSELLALEVRHLALDGSAPQVKIRQRTRWQKGKGQVVGPLKSRHARRELPIPLAVADRLRTHVAGREPGGLVFESPMGGPYDPAHLHSRVLAPACAEAGVEWAGFHTFRHTVASRMFAAGRTPVQVQHWLGHHSAAFTLATYVHLLDPGDLGGPLEPAQGASEVRADPTPLDATGDLASLAGTPDLQVFSGEHAIG